MCNNSDIKQIEKASYLADTEPAEKMDIKRARSFIRASVGSEEKARRSHRPLFIYASAALVAAGIAAVAIMSRPWADSFGAPATLSEETYVHATAAEADSTVCAHSDSLTVNNEAH